MPGRFRPGMNSKMLGAGLGLEIPVRTVSLESPDDGHSQLSCQVGVLAVCLHSASPARIPEYVDVRGPEGKSGILQVLA